VIGGSGIYDLDGLQDVEEVAVATPFGEPSDKYITGRLGNVRMVFLPRHGRGHRVLPHEINYRANIYGMKKLGVEWLISLSAVGSMREDIRPGDMVIVDQFIDITKRRESSFFGDGIAAHVGFGHPVSEPLADILHEAAREEIAAGGGDERAHKGGTYIVMEGPQFSTRGESLMYRKWGVDVIGMTNMPEAKLAREAEISYATIALATDYDCWHEDHDHVSVEAVVAIVMKNAQLARRIVVRAVDKIPAERDCVAATALANAIMTDRQAITSEVRERLGIFIDKYIR
jgi:5'-methylthioadenosine phosphorylase